MQYSFFGKNQENCRTLREKIDKEVKEVLDQLITEKKKTYVKENVADDVPF